MAVGDLDVKLSTYNFFAESESITSSAADAGAVYEPGSRGGSPRAVLLSSSAPFLQSFYNGNAGDEFSADFGIVWDHNQSSSAASIREARIVCDELDVAALTRLSPTAIAARTNLTAGSGGLAGYQADPSDTRAGAVFSGDAPTAQSSNTEARLSFTVTSNVDRPLAGNSTVFVRYTLATLATFPTLVVELWVSGSLVRTLYNSAAAGTATEVVQGQIPSTDIPGSAFEIRAKSTTTGTSVAAASAVMVVAERSGWEADSGWIEFDELNREESLLLDPRKIVARGLPLNIGGQFKNLCARFRSPEFPLRVGEIWIGLSEAPTAAGVTGTVALGEGSSVSRRADGSAQQTPAGGFIAPPGALWPIALRLGWKLVDLASALSFLLRRVGGKGPNSRLAVLASTADWDIVTGIYAATSSIDLEPNRSAGAVKADGLSLVMTK